MKILGSDFDGTLAYGGIGEEKCEWIRKWRKAGNKFGIVTGRGISSAKKVIIKQYTELELDFLLGHNGGTLLDANGNILFETRCEDVSAKQLASELLSWGCKFVHIDSDRHFCAVADLANRPEEVAEEDIVLIDQLPPIKYFNMFTLIFAEPKEAADMAERIRAAYGRQLTPLQNGRVVDIVPIGVNKASGLMRVMELFHAAHEDVITVGDNINDADMIREFRSYAMANGVKAIRDLADGIVSDVTEIIQKEL